MERVTVPELAAMKARGEKIPVLTAYDYTTARILDEAGVPVILVGDSLGMVFAGHPSTLPVTMDEMVYHTRAVSRALKRALLVSDMPFGSVASPVEAVRNAVRLVKEAGAAAVKIEGGRKALPVIRPIVEMDIPVMGHVGLTPQSVHSFGGYRVQGRSPERAEEILEDARAVQEAGAFSIVIEGVPSRLAARITSELKIPTIGIGAGPRTDGQVLVVNDMLGLTTGMKTPTFVKRFARLKDSITEAARRYMEEVRKGAFPGPRETYR